MTEPTPEIVLLRNEIARLNRLIDGCDPEILDRTAAMQRVIDRQDRLLLIAEMLLRESGIELDEHDTDANHERAKAADEEEYMRRRGIIE